MTKALQSRKRLQTRSNISIAATRLFHKRGFDAVTVDEIATAADVGRMTVFNHFPRKEDMFFDREDEAKELLRTIAFGDDPIEALRLFAHQLARDESPLVRFTPASQTYIETIEASDTLKIRARTIRDELWQVLAIALATHLGTPESDPSTQLAAGMTLTAWTVALIHAHAVYRKTKHADKARAAFTALVDRGMRGVKAAM